MSEVGVLVQLILMNGEPIVLFAESACDFDATFEVGILVVLVAAFFCPELVHAVEVTAQNIDLFQILQ